MWAGRVPRKFSRVFAHGGDGGDTPGTHPRAPAEPPSSEKGLETSPLYRFFLPIGTSAFTKAKPPGDSERTNAPEAELSPAPRVQHPSQAPPSPLPRLSPPHQHYSFPLPPLFHIHTICFPRKDWDGILPAKHKHY